EVVEGEPRRGQGGQVQIGAHAHQAAVAVDDLAGLGGEEVGGGQVADGLAEQGGVGGEGGVDRAERGQQPGRGGGAETAYAMKVVGRVAAQGGEVPVLPRLDAAERGEAGRVDEHGLVEAAVADPQHRGVVVDQGERVAVAGHQH